MLLMLITFENGDVQVYGFSTYLEYFETCCNSGFKSQHWNIGIRHCCLIERW